MKCPFIKTGMVPDPKFNKPINYKNQGGNEDYIYYQHTDPYGDVSLVQFCKLIGRKKDIFQCFNENEWRNCPHYKYFKEAADD